MDAINQVVENDYSIYHGDSVDLLRGLPDHCIGHSIFSPPFSSLYTYSASARDLGNCKNDEEFFEHFGYLLEQLTRTMKPGRIAAVHCMPLPTSKARDGFIGARDFPGEIIRAFQKLGWLYHSEVCIWKDPVTAMQRTKAFGLLYKTLRKNAAMSRQGYPDKLVVMRAPGEDTSPIAHGESIGLPEWQKLASPVWNDINPSDTLQYRSAREHEDERHICPLQLEVIRRSIRLWSNPKDVVLSPFAGIGSEGYVALQEGRRFVGMELKASYYEQMKANLSSVKGAQLTLT